MWMKRVSARGSHQSNYVRNNSECEWLINAVNGQLWGGGSWYRHWGGRGGSWFSSTHRCTKYTSIHFSMVSESHKVRDTYVQATKKISTLNSSKSWVILACPKHCAKYSERKSQHPALPWRQGGWQHAYSTLTLIFLTSGSSPTQLWK